MISYNPQDASKKIYVRQEKVIVHIEKKLRAIHLSSDEFISLKEHVKQSLQLEKVQDHSVVSTWEKEQAGIETQLDRLTDLLLKDSITQSAYDRKHTQLQQRHSEIIISLSEQRSEDTEMLEKAMITMLSLCHKSLSLMKSSKTPVKRLLLKTLFSNFELHGKNVRCTMFTTVLDA